MYSDPLKSVTRKLAENVLIASTPFKIGSYGNFGARMTIFAYEDEIFVYSGFPYGKETERCLKELTGKDNSVVTYLIVPNIHHNIAIESFKQKFPQLKVIGSDELESADIKFTIDNGNKVLKKDDLAGLGISSKAFLNNFQVVYLVKHQNKEIVLYNKSMRAIWSADLLIDLGPASVPLESYSPETGWPADVNPNPGHFISAVPQYKQAVNKVNNTEDDEAKIGIKTVYDLDFDTLVPCHGNVVINPKPQFEAYFEFCKPRTSSI